MRLAAFTVDVDRDVNLPVQGRRQACSMCHDGEREEARFSSTAQGLRSIVGLLEEVGVKATFFLEGDTLVHIAREMDVRELLAKHEVACHGVCHEDITGEATGAPLTGPEIGEMLDRGREILRNVLGRDPKGFRAPYQHIDQRTLFLLQQRGFAYDSSLTREVGPEDGSLRPWKVSGELLELPVASGRDRSGRRIVSYLWPMHEGKRVPEDYRHLAASLHEGVMVLATHSWHVRETYGQGMLSEASAKASLNNLRQVLEGVREEGMELLTMEGLVQAWEG